MTDEEREVIQPEPDVELHGNAPGYQIGLTDESGDEEDVEAHSQLAGREGGEADDDDPDVEGHGILPNQSP